MGDEELYDLDTDEIVPIGETIASDVGWFSRRKLRRLARRARKVGRLVKKVHAAPFKLQYKVLRKYGPSIARKAVRAASNPRTLYKGLKLVAAAKTGNVGAMARILKVRKLGLRALRQIARTPPRARVPRKVAMQRVAAASAYTALKAAGSMHRTSQANILRRRGIPVNPRTGTVTAPVLRKRPKGVFAYYQRGYGPTVG